MAATTVYQEQQKKLWKAELLRRTLARRNYADYLPYVHRGAWKKTRMSDYLARRVQEFAEADTGHAYDILLIMTPPQHGKSMTVTESFVSWYVSKYQTKRCILVAYNDSFAEKFGRRNQEKVEEFGESLFGVRRGQKWTKNEWELAGVPGSVISRGIMSGITGNPADLLVIDDPIKNREEADSETYRKKLWEAWSEVLKSRLQAGAKVILIMTPWHEDDLMGRMKAYEENVQIIRLPVEAEEDDLLGRKPGDALCPELGKDNFWLQEFKRGYLNDPTTGGYRSWTALYQCAPRTESGNIIKREWWRFYDPARFGEQANDFQFNSTYISVDATFKDGEKNDFVAIQVWTKRGNQFFLRHSINKHLNFPATVAEIIKIRQLYPDATRVLIEDKANGSAIIQTLQSQMLGVIGITPQGGKEARVNAVSHAIEGGNVFLPDGAAWLGEFIDQCTMFPAGKHDDMVDAMSQALGYMIYSFGGMKLDEGEQRRIAQSNQAINYLTDNTAYSDIYSGGSGGNIYSGFNDYSDPYSGIYDNSGGGYW